MQTNQPRPRPKPKARVAASTEPGPSGEPEISIPQSAAAKDNDELFMRNRKRTTYTWQKLKEIDQKAQVELTVQDNDDEGHTQPKHKKKKPNEVVVPRWQRDQEFVRMLSEQHSENSDDDIIEIKEVNQSPVRKDIRKERSRSRSLTPPPLVPIQEIQKARNLVRQALENVPRPLSPDLLYADDLTDNIILSSELASLAKSVALQSLKGDLRYTAQSVSQQDTVQITVKWQPHPRDPSGVVKVSAYRMNREESFRDLFDAAADDMSVLLQSLVMTYNGKRLFSSASPRALDIWGETEFVACDKATYAYLQANNFARESSPRIERPRQARAEAIEINSDDDSGPSAYSSPPPPQRQTHESEAESEDDDKFKIVLQSSVTQGKHITLTVRPTTKCGAIVKAFLKKAGLTDQYPHVFQDKPAPNKRGRKSQVSQKDPKICVDGDKMSNDTEIGDADLEDGDMVEVVGL
ncbi:hypothetical protein APHAL10511_002726 [Amanita phalloides]|nr:hypothetical protein APHAL10511_002726 [Amanita phalloides]